MNRKNMYDTWVLCDDIGRNAPVGDEKSVTKDREVGMFILWLKPAKK